MKLAFKKKKLEQNKSVGLTLNFFCYEGGTFLFI